MKKVQETKCVYTYNELSKEAKEYAYNDYCDYFNEIDYDINCSNIQEFYENRLDELFENSRLKFDIRDYYCSNHYNISIYGLLDFRDFIPLMENRPTNKKEAAFMDFLKDFEYDISELYCQYSDDLSVAKNCIEAIKCSLDEHYIKGYEKYDNLIGDIGATVADFIESLCREFEQELNDVEAISFEEFSENNGEWYDGEGTKYFLENGEVYGLEQEINFID